MSTEKKIMIIHNNQKEWFIREVQNFVNNPEITIVDLQYSTCMREENCYVMNSVLIAYTENPPAIENHSDGEDVGDY